MQSSKYIKNDDKAITLIAMAVTIIILLILSGVTIATLTSDNGIISNAKVTKMATDFSNYNEEVEQWKIAQSIEKNGDFKEDTLSAGKSNLTYGGGKKEGNIKNIIPDMLDDYLDEIEIIKGTLTINTTNEAKTKAAKIAGITSNPYEIKNGVLESTGSNLDLMASDGTLTIPENVTKIASGAFSRVKGLKTVIIPGNVEEISDYAFSYNATLENVVLNYGIKRIGVSAFDNAVKLSSIKLPESLSSIGERAFRNTALNEIEIPGSVKTLYRLFEGCRQLKSVKINEGVESLKEGLFSSCTSIEKLKIPTTVKEIDGNIFTNCAALEEIAINNNSYFECENNMLINKETKTITLILPKYLNENTTLEIPNGVEQLKCPLNSYNIKKMVIPKSMKQMPTGKLMPETLNEIEIENGNNYLFTKDGMLYNADKKLILCYSNQKIVTVPDEVTEISSYSFYNNKKVEEINCGTNTIKIDGWIFHLDNIKKINIGEKTSSIDPAFNFSKFDFELNIAKNNTYYKAIDGIIYTKDESTIIRCYKTAKNDMKISSKVKTIGRLAFYGQQKLTEYTVPDGVEKIMNSFRYCSNLKKITIPSSVKYIDVGCFGDGTSNLEEIVVNQKENSTSGAPWGAIKGMKVVEWAEK